MFIHLTIFHFIFFGKRALYPGKNITQKTVMNMNVTECHIDYKENALKCVTKTTCLNTLKTWAKQHLDEDKVIEKESTYCLCLTPKSYVMVTDSFANLPFTFQISKNHSTLLVCLKQ